MGDAPDLYHILCLIRHIIDYHQVFLWISLYRSALKIRVVVAGSVPSSMRAHVHKPASPFPHAYSFHSHARSTL